MAYFKGWYQLHTRQADWSRWSVTAGRASSTLSDFGRCFWRITRRWRQVLEPSPVFDRPSFLQEVADKTTAAGCAVGWTGQAI